jgi:hypothetical protein
MLKVSSSRKAIYLPLKIPPSRCDAGESDENDDHRETIGPLRVQLRLGPDHREEIMSGEAVAGMILNG